MPAQHHSTKLKVEVDGSPVAHEVDLAVVSAFVDNCSSLPDMFQVTFRDPHRKILEDAKVKVGSKVKLKVFSDADAGGELLVTGEVTALEAEVDPDGTMTIVRGFDLAHRLFRGRVTEAYTNVTYSDIASKVAKKVGLEPGQIDPSPGVHDHVTQANVTYWQFLRGLADEIGFEVQCLEGKFVFRKPPHSSDAPGEGDLNADNPAQLTLGKNLLRFRAIVTSAEQVSQVQVRGYDVAQKRALVGVAPAQTSSASIGIGPTDLASPFNSPDHISVDTPFRTQAECDAAAKSRADQVAGAFAEFEGVARGDAKLRSGKAVSLGLVGKPFDGKYTVTSTRHCYDPKDGYTTWFTVSGRQDRSLYGLVSAAGSGSGTAMGPHVYGVVQAIVTDVRDPQNQGRVKLKFPWLDDTYATDWARTVQWAAGKQRGSMFLPEVNDEVLVAFEQGDVRRPYVIGGLYNGVDTPPLDGGVIDGGSGAVKKRLFVSKKNHVLSFEDDDSKSGVWLKTGSGNLVISLDATGTKITVDAASGDVEIKGNNIKVEASGSLELKGSGGVKIDGGASVEVKGGSIKLN